MCEFSKYGDKFHFKINNHPNFVEWHVVWLEHDIFLYKSFHWRSKNETPDSELINSLSNGMYKKQKWS